MLATRVACPNCTKPVTLSAAPQVGKKLRCPKCGCPFTVSAADCVATSHTVRPSAMAAPPTMQMGIPVPKAPHMPLDAAPAPPRIMLVASILGGLVLLLGGTAALALYFANREKPATPAQQLADTSIPSDRSSTSDDDDEKKPIEGQPWLRAQVVDTPPRRVDPPREEPKRTPDPEPTQPVNIENPAPPAGAVTTLAPDLQAKVNKAIDRGVVFLRKQQFEPGNFGEHAHLLGNTALAALTLVECGVSTGDSAIKRAATYVRTHAPAENRTYEIALSILFLDRLGDKKDEALLRTLGLRLIGGQTASGGWSYYCDVLSPEIEKRYLLVLEQTRPRNPLELFTGADGKLKSELLGIDKSLKLPPEFTAEGSKLDIDGPFRGVAEGISKLEPNRGGSTIERRGDDMKLTPEQQKLQAQREDEARKALKLLPKKLQENPSLQPPSAAKKSPIHADQSDNSNTQFAILGVLGATRHGVPTERAMGFIVQRFRTSQNFDGGWGYHYIRGGGATGTPAMTGAGLLGLAVTHGLTAGVKFEGMAAQGVQDTGIQKGLKALSRNIEKPLGGKKDTRARTPVNPYFLWTVERVGMLYGLHKIADKDWYLWGTEVLLPVQQEGGQFEIAGYHGTTPMLDTCFVLLFLKRANLAKDLTHKLKNKLELLIEDKD